MTDVGFDRTEVELVASLWSPKDSADAFTLDRIANGGTSVVGFDEKNLHRIDAGNLPNRSIKDHFETESGELLLMYSYRFD